MELIADGLLIATALTAGLYCLVLSRRLRRLSDSGDGIGVQIDSLDRVLAETRSALAETRNSVTELRESAKTSLTQLSHETSRAVEMALRIEGEVARAEAVMQRLYEAGSRIEAHEARVKTEKEAGLSGPRLDAEVGKVPRVESEPEAVGAYDPPRTVDQVALPEDETSVVLTVEAREPVEPDAADAPDSDALVLMDRQEPATPDGSVLKVERMML